MELSLDKNEAMFNWKIYRISITIIIFISIQMINRLNALDFHESVDSSQIKRSPIVVLSSVEPKNENMEPKEAINHISTEIDIANLIITILNMNGNRAVNSEQIFSDSIGESKIPFPLAFAVIHLY